jgi:hypothetical protein
MHIIYDAHAKSICLSYLVSHWQWLLQLTRARRNAYCSSRAPQSSSAASIILKLWSSPTKAKAYDTKVKTIKLSISWVLLKVKVQHSISGGFCQQLFVTGMQ